jgi:NADH-quinone oxidoreductase subunit E
MLEALRMIQQARAGSRTHIWRRPRCCSGPIAELEDIATFYSLIFRRPVGETGDPALRRRELLAERGDAVRDALMELGIGFGETTPDGKYTLINICCVGGCDRAPAAVVGRDRRSWARCRPRSRRSGGGRA